MASPWGKIEHIETVNFADIMSEEYARDLQSKENAKYAKQIQEDLLKQAKEKEIIDPGEGSSLSNHRDDEVDEVPSTSNIEILPEDVLNVIQHDDSSSHSILSDVCDSDALIAQVLQAQFDHEYNEELKRYEKAKNKQSKISISFDKYRRPSGNESDYDDDDTALDDDYDNPKRDWDRFETNEKKFNAIPPCGFKHDGEGSIVTKHDLQICGVRNACRIMSFPPEFPTGDGAGFDMKLPNSVFNELKKANSRKMKKSKMHDRKENIATTEMGVDAPTRLLLFKLINNQILDQVNGIISTGKEALILHANSDPSYAGDLLLPKECAIKIFKTTLNEFKQRDRYIKDDYRFKDRKQNGRAMINMWAEKEMHNMMRMQKYGINCPDVVILKKHVLVMSFIGDNHNAAPKLKDARLSLAELSLAYEEIIQMMYKLYNEANLVHADLSEYNILWYDDKCWFIDVAQSIEPKHPSALEFLMRDCDNIITFFTRRGLPSIYTKEQLFEHITTLNPENYCASMLERIHTQGTSLKEAMVPNQEAIPDENKSLSYPFDLAWEKSLIDKNKLKNENTPSKTLNCRTSGKTVEDALQILKIQRPIECDGNSNNENE